MSKGLKNPKFKKFRKDNKPDFLSREKIKGQDNKVPKAKHVVENSADESFEKLKGK